MKVVKCAGSLHVLLFLFISPIIFRQNYKYLGIGYGLSNNIVTTIYQDHNGFMWFGTYDGLNRYGGYDFKIFRNKIGESTLRSNLIYNIEEVGDKNLWATLLCHSLVPFDFYSSF